MKETNKALFAVLLIPAYLTIIIVSLGSAMGSIRWGYTVIVLLLLVIGAWFASHRNKMIFNAIGFISFLISGGYIIVSSILKPGNQKSGFEYLEISMGAIVVLFVLAPLLYPIVKRRSSNKKT